MVNSHLRKLLRIPLVTGAGGYIGSQLVRFLVGLDEVEKVLAIDVKQNLADERLFSSDKLEFLALDLSSSESLSVLRRYEPSSVFALAALNGTSRFYSNPWTVYANSLIPTLNTIKAFADRAPIVYSSSSEVYASSVEMGTAAVPTSEKVPLSISDPHNPRWSYATAKMSGEIALISHAKELGSRGVIVRYHNVYGPNMPPDHFIPDFINRVRNNDFKLLGGANTRSFLFIDDAIKGTVMALAKASTEVPIFHLGTSEEMSISEAADVILAAMNIKGELEILAAPEGSVSRRLPNTARAYEELRWRPKYSFKDGVAEMFRRESVVDKFV